MKAKDFTNEGLFSDLSKVASDTISAYKTRSNATKGITSRIGAMFSPSRMKYGRSTQDQVAANKFINKFVNGALETLEVAVKNGLVDTNSNDLTAHALDAEKDDKIPVLSREIKVINDEPMILRYRNIDYVIGNKGQWVSAKTNKEPPQSLQMFLHKQADIATPKAKTATPEGREQAYQKLNFIFESYMYLLEASSVPQGGGRVKGAALSQTPGAIRKRQARAAKKAGSQGQNTQQQTPPPQQNTQQQTPPPQQNTQQQTPPTQNPVRSPAANSQLSISRYFRDKYLNPFFKGIDMSTAKPKVDALLQNLPELYRSGKLKKELENLANIAWTLAKQQ